MATSESSNSGSARQSLEHLIVHAAKSQSYHEVARPLIRKSELMNDVRGDEAFVIVRGSPPLRCGRAIYFRRPEMVAQVAPNRFYKRAM